MSITKILQLHTIQLPNIRTHSGIMIHQLYENGKIALNSSGPFGKPSYPKAVIFLYLHPVPHTLYTSTPHFNNT